MILLFRLASQERRFAAAALRPRKFVMNALFLMEKRDAKHKLKLIRNVYVKKDSVYRAVK